MLDHGQLKSVTGLVNIVALDLELAVFSLQQYLSTSSQTDFQDPSKLELIKFIVEQLQLVQVKKEAG